jgi:hypothetical protein
VEGSKMTDAEAPVERQELGERLLGLIGGYRMGVALNAQDLFTKTTPESPPPAPVIAADRRHILTA